MLQWNLEVCIKTKCRSNAIKRISNFDIWCSTRWGLGRMLLSQLSGIRNPASAIIIITLTSAVIVQDISLCTLNHACSTFLWNWPLFFGRNLFGRKSFGQIAILLLWYVGQRIYWHSHDIGWTPCIGRLDQKVSRRPLWFGVASGLVSQPNFFLIVTAVRWSWKLFDCKR